MPAGDNQYDEQLLTRYLLGAVSDEEAEHLDESSVTDDEFALRLDALENDLVDAYVQGGLTGDTLERFEKFYLSSPPRREKLELARALVRYGEKAATAVAQEAAAPAYPSFSPREREPQGPSSSRRWFAVPSRALPWGFAAAALATLLAAGYLFVENEGLRKQVTEARAQQMALEQRTEELERAVSEQRSANSGLLKELEDLRQSSAGSHTLKIITALLLPQTRGVGEIPTISVAKGTDRLALRMQLEADDFPTYQVALRDVSTNQLLWRSPKLVVSSEGESKVVSIRLAAGILKQQRYGLELLGISANGASVFISSYFFRLTVE